MIELHSVRDFEEAEQSRHEQNLMWVKDWQRIIFTGFVRSCMCSTLHETVRLGLGGSVFCAEHLQETEDTNVLKLITVCDTFNAPSYSVPTSPHSMALFE